MNRRKILTSFLITPFLSCLKNKTPNSMIIDVSPDFFKSTYVGLIDGKMCFNYKLKDKKLSLVPSIKTIGIIGIKTFPELDSLYLSNIKERTSFGPIYQIDKLIYKE